MFVESDDKGVVKPHLGNMWIEHSNKRSALLALVDDIQYISSVAATVISQASSDRLTLSGPQVALSPNQVMAISLGAHELTTNAIKYGAPSNEAGTVSVTWSVSESDNIRELVIEWVERAGPLVFQPTKRGFGSRLLERMMASEGGTVNRTFEPEGVTCTLKFRL